MAAHPVTLRLPEALYDLFQSRAERAHRSLEAELWHAAQNRLSAETRSQLDALNLKQQREKLTRAEKETLGRLVHQYDQTVLLRAEAARLLKERGHDASKLLTASAP